MKKSVLVAIIVCAVFIFAALFVVLKFNTEKRHNEYIANRTFTFNEDVFVFSFLGLDGYGTPHASVNRQEVFYALMPALGFEEENTNTIPVMKDIYEHINVVFSEKKDLSNGQIITAQVSVDRTCLDEYDIYFKETEFQVTVKGLEEIEGVDIFDDIYIDTVETDGLVNVSWEHVGKRSFENIMIESGIKCRPLGSLNYGDKFTLLITSEQAELFKKLYGINPVVLEREYVLQESSNEYLSDFEKVSDRLISIINKEDIETFMKNLELLQGAVENAKWVVFYIVLRMEKKMMTRKIVLFCYIN